MRGYAVREWPEPVLGALVGAVAGLALHVAVTPGKRDLLAQLRQSSRRGLWLFALVGLGNIGGQIFSIGAMRHIPIGIACFTGHVFAPGGVSDEPADVCQQRALDLQAHWRQRPGHGWHRAGGVALI